MKKKLLLVIPVLLVVLGIGLWAIVSIPRKLPAKMVFAVLPDTQLYSQFRPDIFDSQTQWIVDNKEERNIDFVLHVGDIVNAAYVGSQWETASASMAMLEEAGIPYAVVTGNHDVDFDGSFVEDEEFYDDMRKESENFLKYFPRERFAAMETYGGISENGFNTYHFIPCGEYEILVLALDWLPSDATLKWAEEILMEYSDKPTIILKHDFIKPRKGGNSSPTVQISNDETEKQWELFSRYNQIFMIVNGHFTGSDFGTLENDFGNEVFMMVVDYQGKILGGNGWMRLLELDFENSCITGETFSPYVAAIPEHERTEEDLEVLEDEHNKFKFPFDLKERFETIQR